MASTINDERVGELERMGARARTYTAYSYGDVKPSDKPTDDKLRLVEGARVMLLANMPDYGLANGSLGTVLEAGVDCVTVEFDDCEYPVEVSEKEWKVLKSSVRDFIGDDGNPAQELVTDTVGAFTQIPLRLAFAITIHKSQGQTFERCAVHSKVFGAGMLYVALSRCTTFGWTHRVAEDRASTPLRKRVCHRVLRLPLRQDRESARTVARRPVRCGCSCGRFASAYGQGGAD